MKPVEKKKDIDKKVESFDEIIFQNRNKEYGAYQLRKNYYKRLIPGFILMLIIAGLMKIYQMYIVYTNQYSDLGEDIFYYDPSVMANLDELAYLQLLEPPKKSEQLDQKTKEDLDNLVPKIVDSITQDNPEEIDKNLQDTSGIENDTSTIGSDGFETGMDNGNFLSYNQVDSLPQFPGGDLAMRRFIVNNIKYPEQAIKNNITGIVYVRFRIKHDGNIDNIQLIKGVNPLLDAEAIRLVKLMPKWKPGKYKNKNVPILFNLPINFNLRGKSS
jgi:periplasmic protein TonB